MKKWIVLSMVLILTIVLTGCSGLSKMLSEPGSLSGYITYTSGVSYTSVDESGQGGSGQTAPEPKVRIAAQKEVSALNMHDALKNAMVEAVGENGRVAGIDMTGSSGYFEITGLDPGQYDVFFSHPNFNRFSVKAWVFPGVENTVTGANFPLVHYLLVAIDNYPGTEYDLNGSLNSADSFKDQFIDKNNLSYYVSFPEEFYLKNTQANRSKIESQIYAIGKGMEPRDRFVFYYVGRGAKTNTTEYLHTYITGGGVEPDEMVSEDDLQKWFSLYLPSKNITVILDSGYSGGFVRQSLDGISKQNQETGLEASTLNVFAQDLWVDGYSVITSTGGDEKAIQVDLNGKTWAPLTYCLVDGVRSPYYLADGDIEGTSPDREISVQELFKYAEYRVPSVTNGKNHPQQFLGSSNPVLFKY